MKIAERVPRLGRTLRFPAGIAFLAFGVLLAGCLFDSKKHSSVSPLKITAQPADVTVAVNGKAVFIVKATGSGALTYQWSKNGAALGSAVSDTLTLNGVAVSDSGSKYKCRIKAGNDSLWSNDAVLKVTDTTGTSDTTGSISRSSKSFATGGVTDANAVLDIYAGTYPVAIYGAEPAGLLSGIGSGTMQLSRNGDNVSITLRKTSGALLVSLTQNRITPVGGGSVVVNQPLGQVTVSDFTNPFYTIGAVFGTSPDGMITGVAGLGGTSNTYYFRNNIVLYGSTIPAAFAQLAGTWAGASEAGACGANTITAVILADGHVTVTGKGSADCLADTVSNVWNGNDDFAVPLADGSGYDIVIDGQKTGGSQSKGGIHISVSNLQNPTFINKVSCGLATSQGSFTTNNPAKQ